MFVGGSQQIKYGILPANATNTNVTFKSLDEKVATVDKDGVVTGVSKGNTKVIVTTEEGGFTAECTVNVDGIEIKGFERVGGRDITLERIRLVSYRLVLHLKMQLIRRFNGQALMKLLQQ